MTLNQGIIWVLAQRRDTWGKVYPDEEKENVFPASCQIIAESHPRICGGVEEGEGIACSWNVLRVGIFSDSTWCITTVVLNYIVCCSREEEKKKNGMDASSFRTECTLCFLWSRRGVFWF